MPTLGAGLASWNNIDDSRWIIYRTRVADLPLDSPSHELGVILSYIACPPPEGKRSKGTVLLIHGFPQTNYQYRRVITPIADAGYTVIAPDNRGIGQSSKPINGYTKASLAQDLHTLLEEIGVTDKVHVVGHGTGGMIAHAYAALFPKETGSVAWGESPMLGTQYYKQMKHSMAGWHFSFHMVPDLPELLVAGKEKMYLKHFFDRFARNANAISAYDLEVYANAYAMPGTFRAAFNCHRTMEQDGKDNYQWLNEKGKCTVPCLSLWGVGYMNEDDAVAMCSEFYETVTYHVVPGAGHWIAEEKPAEFCEILLDWFEQSSRFLPQADCPDDEDA